MALLNAACALLMTGVAWYVQLVHYPLLARVPSEAFPAYQEENIARTSRLVGPLMLLEGAASLLLVILRPGVLAALGFFLLCCIWAATWLLYYPQHRALARSFDREVHRRLVSSHWFRALAWTARSALSLLLL